MRTVHQLHQGSSEWSAHRARIFNASEAPGVMGASKHTTRTALLAQKSTGLTPEVSAARQTLFDRGHAVEGPTVALIEEVIGDSLAPVVASIEVEGLTLGASYDGLSMLEDVGAEVKLWNEDLAAQVRSGILDMHYVWQLEQQFIVTPTLERIIFATCDGTREKFVWMEYRPVSGRREQLIAAWHQFEADRAAYVPAESTTAAVAAPVEALPAISARIEGSLAIHSNLDVFGAALRTYIDRIPAKPTTDQEFADCDAACKALKRAEEALDGAEANALGQVQSVEQLTRTIADLRNVARTARLASEKVVKARKDQIRVEECQRGRRALDDHIRGLIQQIGAPYMPEIVADFGAAISGLKSLDSLRAKVDQLLADKKIEANEIAGRITLNLRTMKSHGDYDFLFSDLKSIVTKQPDDFQALVQSRVLAHKAEEQSRAAAAAEKERERIRSEEVAKLQRELDERAHEAARQAAAATPVATPAPAPVAPPAVSQKPEAANSPTVVPITRGNPTLKIGDIQEAFGLPITAAFIESTLKIAPAKRENRAVWFYDTDFDRIRQALMFHIERAPAPKQLEEAA